MHLATSIPDWNSLESVRRAHSDLEAIALVFFALLVLFDVLANLSKDQGRKTLLEKCGLCFFAVAVIAEIAAYPYGQRNDALSGKMISSLSVEAGDAAAAADRANKSANNADTEAGAAQDKADAVGEKANNLDGQLDIAKKQLADAEAEEEKERQELINVAVCSAPRVIPFWFLHGKSSLDPLRSFAGYQAIIEFVPDAEARRAALQIWGTLNRAGWSAPPPTAVDDLTDGVWIRSYSPDFGKSISQMEHISQMDEMRQSKTAAGAIVDFLHLYDWQANSIPGPPNDGNLSGNAIRIEVGLYPAALFVTPPGEKEIAPFAQQLNKTLEEQRKRTDADLSKEIEESQRNLPPEEAASVRADLEHLMAEEDRQIQPCRTPSDFFATQ
jgi:hypothetical protein